MVATWVKQIRLFWLNSPRQTDSSAHSRWNMARAWRCSSAASVACRVVGRWSISRWLRRCPATWGTTSTIGVGGAVAARFWFPSGRRWCARYRCGGHGATLGTTDKRAIERTTGIQADPARPLRAFAEHRVDYRSRSPRGSAAAPRLARARVPGGRARLGCGGGWAGRLATLRPLGRATARAEHAPGGHIRAVRAGAR